MGEPDFIAPFRYCDADEPTGSVRRGKKAERSWLRHGVSGATDLKVEDGPGIAVPFTIASSPATVVAAPAAAKFEVLKLFGAP